MFKPYSDESRKLIFSLIEDFAKCYYEKTTNYYIKEAETLLKKEYLEHQGINDMKPFSNFRDKVEKIVKEAKTQANPTEYLINELEEKTLSEIQRFLIATKTGFSMRKEVFSQKQANKFIDWLIDYLMANDIEIKKPIIEMLKKNDEDKLAYVMLKNKKCCICGRTATIHHHKSVASIGGYKNDKGQLPISPLCKFHHGELHNAIDRNKWIEEHPTYLKLKCNEKQIEVLKKIYPNFFEDFYDKMEEQDV